MTLGSLFDGISGFPLAASWAGIETKWISEIDPYCLKVSKKNFPNAIQYGNIKEISNPEYVDIISGGFPCQPFSVAGKQQGKEDNRYLWPQMLRVIREVKPRWVIGENVPGIINLALEEVLTSLENEGYKTETFIIPACATGAPHRRDRVWIVAHSDSIGKLCRTSNSDRKNENKEIRSDLFFETYRSSSERTIANSYKFNGNIPGFYSGWLSQQQKTSLFFDYVANTNSFQRCKRRMYENGSEETERHVSSFYSFTGRNWENFPTQSGICRRDDGIPNRVDRIKALGNAIVPQVAYEIFKAIVSIEKELQG
jgi:DNA (cytosine-5)-methyltransferase 1